MALSSAASVSEAVGDRVPRSVIGGSCPELDTWRHGSQEQSVEFLHVHVVDKAPIGGTSRVCAADHETGAKLPLSLYPPGYATARDSTQNRPTTEILDEMKETAKMLDGTFVEPTCTSTPVSNQRTYSSCGFSVSKDQVRFSDSCKDGDDSTGENAQINETTQGEAYRVLTASNCNKELVDPKDISVPIRGYEIMEQRARFTVFKIQVFRMSHDSWYVFRRYTDFVQLNDKLVGMFPGFRLALPSKKWFGDNFDPNFLEDRQLGLQAFINNITGHKDICNSQPCRDFFCFDDPPGPHDSIEESRSLCEALEEQLYNTKKVLEDREVEIGSLREEREMFKTLVESLQTSLRIQRTLNRKPGEVLPSPQSSDASLAECDQPQTTPGNKTPITVVGCSGDTTLESGIGQGTVTTFVGCSGDTTLESGIEQGTVTTLYTESPVSGVGVGTVTTLAESPVSSVGVGTVTTRNGKSPALLG